MVMCIAWTTDVHAQSRVEEDALAFLNSLSREWSGNSARDCRTYEQKNIDKLSRPFAISAAAFLKAFVAMHGHVTITSAHRTVEEQRCVCEGEKGPCAGRPRVIKRKKGKRTLIIVKQSTSHHQTGFALDVRAGTGSDDEFMCMHEFARMNPSFGVTFPLGKRDRPHMEPSGTNQSILRVASLGGADGPVVPCTKIRMMLTYETGD